MAGTAAALPHWDMTVVFPSLDSPEFTRGFEAATQSIAELGELFDRHAIGGEGTPVINAATITAF